MTRQHATAAALAASLAVIPGTAMAAGLNLPITYGVSTPYVQSWATASGTGGQEALCLAPGYTWDWLKVAGSGGSPLLYQYGPIGNYLQSGAIGTEPPYVEVTLANNGPGSGPSGIVLREMWGPGSLDLYQAQVDGPNGPVTLSFPTLPLSAGTIAFTAGASWSGSIASCEQINPNPPAGSLTISIATLGVPVQPGGITPQQKATIIQSELTLLLKEVQTLQTVIQRLQ